MVPIQKLTLIVFAAAIAAVGCSEPEVPGGRITIRNDVLDKTFNAFTIDEVLAGGGSAGFRRTLKPGESATIPVTHVTSFRVTRRYEDYSRVYVVECPDDMNRAVLMKLIDIHSNRLGGGCVLAKRGETRGGTTRWEKN